MDSRPRKQPIESFRTWWKLCLSSALPTPQQLKATNSPAPFSGSSIIEHELPLAGSLPSQSSMRLSPSSHTLKPSSVV